MDKKISDKIKVFGFVMTCCMVFYHCGTLDNSYAVAAWDSSLNNILNKFVVNLGIFVMCWFFTITGFLLFNGLEFGNLLRKLKSRVFSLLIPYIAWQAITAVKLALQGKYTFTFGSFIQKNFLLADWPHDGALWYVYAVFLLALLSPVLLVFFKNKYVAFGAVLAGIVLSVWAMRTGMGFVAALRGRGFVANIISYLPAYLIGAFYGKFYRDLEGLGALKYIAICLLTAFLLEGALAGFFADMAIRVLPILCLAVLPAVPARLADLKIYSLSFLIYALHQPMIADINPLLIRLYTAVKFPPLFLYNVLAFLVMLAIITATAALIWVVLNRLAPPHAACADGWPRQREKERKRGCDSLLTGAVPA